MFTLIAFVLLHLCWRAMVFRALKNSFNAHTDVETGFDSLINRSPPRGFSLALLVADIKIKGNTFLVVTDQNLSEKKKKKTSSNTIPEVINLLNYELNVFQRIYIEILFASLEKCETERLMDLKATRC